MLNFHQTGAETVQTQVRDGQRIVGRDVRAVGRDVGVVDQDVGVLNLLGRWFESDAWDDGELLVLKVEPLQFFRCRW